MKEAEDSFFAVFPVEPAGSTQGQKEAHQKWVPRVERAELAHPVRRPELA